MFRRNKITLAAAVLLVITASCRQGQEKEVAIPAREVAAALSQQALESAADRSRPGLQSSVDLFDQAIALDSQFAPAWSGLASSLALQGLYSHKPPRETLGRALPAAQQALQLATDSERNSAGPLLSDQEISTTHASMALVLFLWSHDFSAAEDSFKKALEADQSSGQTHHWYAMMLHATGRHPEAVERIRLAVEADPESRLLQVKLATVLLGAGRLEEAKAQLDSCLLRFPDFSMTHRELGNHALLRGEPQVAVGHFENAVAKNQKDVRSISLLAQTRATLGETEQATAVLTELDLSEEFISQTSLALIEVGLGNHDGAMDRLGRAYEQREPSLVYINSRAGFRSLKENAAFLALVEEIGLRAAHE